MGQVENIPTGSTTSVPVNAPGRSGLHIVYPVWQASQADQAYYFCSDVFCSDVNLTG